MNTPPSRSASNPDGARLNLLIATLQTFRCSGLKTYWRVYVVALGYAIIAWFAGKDLFLLYLGLLIVIFMLHEMSLRRVERQLDSVIETLLELQKEK